MFLYDLCINVNSKRSIIFNKNKLDNPLKFCINFINFSSQENTWVQKNNPFVQYIFNTCSYLIPSARLNLLLLSFLFFFKNSIFPISCKFPKLKTNYSYCYLLKIPKITRVNFNFFVVKGYWNTRRPIVYTFFYIMVH